MDKAESVRNEDTRSRDALAIGFMIRAPRWRPLAAKEIAKALRSNRWNITHAAAAMGVSRRVMHDWITELGAELGPRTTKGPVSRG